MRAEYTAFKARLEAAPVLATKIDTAVRLKSDGEAVRTNYVIAYPASPVVLDDGRFTALQRAESASEIEYDVRFVAVDADGVLILAEAANAQLIGHALVVPGRVCTPIFRAPGASRVEFDRTARLYYLDSSYRFNSNPG